MKKGSKKIVVSGVNLVEGGIVSILQDCVMAISNLYDEYNLDVTILLHTKSVLNQPDRRLKLLEFPSIKQSWSKRILFEYFSSKKISKKIKPDLWISLHDMTPNVDAKIQVVYCHNPSPFYKTKISDLFIDRKLFLFSYFYKYLYSINIRKNSYVIIQQNWLRLAFERMYKVPTIVAYPSIQTSSEHSVFQDEKNNDPLFTFFYPSFARIFKNFEVLFEATLLLAKKRNDFQVVVTIDASSTKLGAKLYKKYGACNNIKFIGKQTRDQVYQIYQSCRALIFPSKLETWGLPLTEAKEFNKPILAANLEYARENIQDYDKVKFFNPDNADELAKYMEALIIGDLVFDKNYIIEPAQPFFKDWEGLLKFLIKETSK